MRLWDNYDSILCDKRHFDNYEIIMFFAKYIWYDCHIEWEDFKFCYFNPKLFKPYFSFEMINFEKINECL